MQCRMIGYRETMYVEESMLNNSPDRWGLTARLMHGIGVALIFILVIHGWWMTELATPGGRLNHYTWHASFGYAVLLLTTLRLAWRSQTAAPQPPEGATKSERNLAWLGHMGLYLLTLGTAVQGWALAGTFDTPLDARLLGVIPMPMIMSGQSLHEPLVQMHTQFAWMLAALVLVHILAAIYHQFFKKDGLFRRMFW